jgi:HK97 family phage major capsid protein
MAVSAATALSGFSGFLTPEQAGPIFQKTLQSSVVQTLAQKIPLGAAGVTVPVVTGEMSAGWVAEGAAKPASSASLALKTMSPKKIATIAIVSAEVVRANPGGYMDLIRPQIAKAFAVAFDSAVLHGTSTPFANYLDQSAKAAELGAHTGAEGSVYRDLNTALELLVRDGKYLTGWALDAVMEPTLLAGVDNNGRPIFLPIEPPYETTDPASPGSTGQPIVRNGRLFGRPTSMAPGVATADLRTIVGYAGDWSQVVWGQIGGISYDVSTQATATINGTLTSLWENNLVGIRAETEFGFLCNDVQAFVKLTNAIGS